MQQTGSYAFPDGYRIHNLFSVYWQKGFTLNPPACCQNCQLKPVTFLLFLPGQWIFSYFYRMSFYTTDLDNRFQACFCARGSSKPFLLKSFSQIGQREIWSQACHNTADYGKHQGTQFPFFVSCTGKSWHWSKSCLPLFLDAVGLELYFPASDFLLANLDFVDRTLKCLNLPSCNFMSRSELQAPKLVR